MQLFTNLFYFLVSGTPKADDHGLECDEQTTLGNWDFDMSQAQHGYDVFMSDVWSAYKADPGIKKKVFDFACGEIAGNQKTQGFRKFVEHFPAPVCSNVVESTSVTSYEQYYKESNEWNKNEVGISTTGEASYGSVSASWSASYNHEGSNEQTKMKNFFQDSSAEIDVGKTQCIKKIVEVTSNKNGIGGLRPLFSRNFIKALKAIDNSLSNNDMATAETQMKQLVGEFGTHYVARAEFGYAMRYEQRYTSRSKTVGESNEREKCTKDEVKACLGASGSAGMCVLELIFLNRYIDFSLCY